jgi:hypothetical protein
MFDFLDDIHSQALSDSRDLILKIDVCINWGVSAVLLPELHCSHFMGSIIPLMTRLSLIKRMIEVRNVNWGGYYPGGRRSISVRSERVQSEADSNAGIKDNDSGSSLSNDEDDDSFDREGRDNGDSNNGDSNLRADGNKGQHCNASDMTIHAEDSGIDDWSVTDSHTTDSYSVDLLNSD